MSASSRTVQVLFLASPGDLVPERRAARNVIEELNKSLREMDWHFDVIGWEDTNPGVGRPQELINRDMERCDVFVGLLWKRWGQSTGKYSSGFEEEFENAISRRTQTGSPEIWLAFKEIDEQL